ncbi:hypothetical protein LWI29_033093 [Acer saccharum]|uniref:Uncharacterized protein n=1 Tax=Acer saccharum TaxID=4024 RepID=A0AA39SXN9_ACESA|nr:hypothetical protein LWI29_033093 [Acer saccharum]
MTDNGASPKYDWRRLSPETLSTLLESQRRAKRRAKRRRGYDNIVLIYFNNDSFGFGWLISSWLAEKRFTSWGSYHWQQALLQSRSLVTRACDPSGGNETVGHWFDPSSRVHGWLMTGLPVSSQELVPVSPAKAGATWILERRAQREAGFTEQRLPPSLGSERITGRCHLDPTWFCGLGSKKN